MKKLIFIALINIITINLAISQGTIRGNVSDENGEYLTGATIVLKNNNSVATIADFEGNYSLKVPAGKQVIRITFIGYQSVEDTIHVENGKVAIYDYILSFTTTEIEEAIVIGKANRAKDAYMREVKMKSVNSIDFISKETIKKTGDSQVDDAIKRVTGVSTVQGFITVRGLADRYVKTTINGARIPTLDPLTNNIKLDMFPTSLIDNIVVTKTQSPDLPGDWAGAYLSIDTRDYPQKFMLSIKTSVGYNPQTTFKNVVSSEKSPTDWLGFDEGFRDVDHSKFSEYSSTLNDYQKLTGNDLEVYLNSIGVNSSHFQGAYYENIYYKLSLIELGLLAPGNIYDNPSIIAANQPLNYNESLYNNAFININTPASDFGQTLPNNWMTIKQQAPLSFSQDFTLGNQIIFLDRPLGFLAGFRYSNSIKSDPASTQNSWVYNQGQDAFTSYSDYVRNVTSETSEWSALLGASYKISPFHSISFLYMPNMSGVNKARVDSGYFWPADAEHGIYEVIKHNHDYEERQQMVYQLISNHYIPIIKLKIDLFASYTDGESSTPDIKSFSYGKDSSYDSLGYIFTSGSDRQRTFRYLDENILDTRFSGEIPVSRKKEFIRRLKFGTAYLSNTRETDQYIYNVEGTGGGSYLYIRNPSELNNQNLFQITQNRQGSLVMHRYYDGALNNDMLFNIGHNIIKAGFLMLDYEITSKIRVSGGFRIENTDLFNDVKKYYELGLPKDDPGRKFDGGGQIPGLNSYYANPANITSTDFLPNINILFKILSTDKITINSRYNYGKSLARPSIREVSPFFMFDYELQGYVFGNPFLQISNIDNYDIRLESYFKNNQFFSLGFFLKQFTNHIEMVYQGVYQWSNANFGEAHGVEFEGKKEIINNLSLSANVTFVKSNTKVDIYDKNDNTRVIGNVERTMFGQAPFIVNGLLDYTLEKMGITAALSYNVQGKKVALPSTNKGVPDVYELPIHRLDFKLGKTLWKNFSMEFKIRNILKQSVTRAYYYEGSYEKYPFDSYNYGTDCIISLSYDL
ncbi:MAG: carboxypeptidase-like regulatory domain-containing protein [Bacteroidales bacterium]|nr:carboxypeptidase-like regulatory domain-containing protein [Bacteroidales bacterium]